MTSRNWLDFGDQPDRVTLGRVRVTMDGATVLKVGGNFFDPHFLASGGTKYCLDS